MLCRARRSVREIRVVPPAAAAGPVRARPEAPATLPREPERGVKITKRGGCSGEREHGNHSVTRARTGPAPTLDRAGPGRMCDEPWQQDLACVHWRLARGRVFFSVLGPAIPGNHMMREGDDGM